MAAPHIAVIQSHDRQGDLGLGIVAGTCAAISNDSFDERIVSHGTNDSHSSAHGSASDLSEPLRTSLSERTFDTSDGENSSTDHSLYSSTAAQLDATTVLSVKQDVQSRPDRLSLPITTPRRPSLHGLHVSSGSVNTIRRSSSTRGHGRERSADEYPDILDHDIVTRFRYWLVSFAVVDFDLDFGQKMESAFPSFHFSEVEKKNIAFSSFPDRTVGSDHTLVYSFRARASASISSPSPRRDYGPLSPSLEGVERASSLDGFWYCGVYFRQKKDPSRKRGYFLKSFVVISHLPYIGLLERLAELVGAQYFRSSGSNARVLLETAVRDIADWTAPYPSSSMTLPLLGEIFRVELPSALCGGKPQISLARKDLQFGLGKSTSEDAVILASRPTRNLLSIFEKVLPHLWTIWELMIMGEPILICTNSPQLASDAVWACLELIKPIAYCGDYRPYLTLQDADLGRFVGRRTPSEPLVVGVTNPYFLTACDNWPNILSLDQLDQKPKTGHPQMAGRTRSSGLHTSYIRMVSRDRAILMRMQSALAHHGHNREKIDLAALDEELRRHFAALTERFLAPLNRFHGTLVPHDPLVTSSWLKRPINVKAFRHDLFLRSLAQHGSAISFKPRPSPAAGFTVGRNALAQAFYGKWILCGNFASWLENRSLETLNELSRRRALNLCDLDIDKWLLHKDRKDGDALLLLTAMQSHLQAHKSRVISKGGPYAMPSASTSRPRSDSAYTSHAWHNRSTSSPVPHSPTLGSDETPIFVASNRESPSNRHHRATSTSLQTAWNQPPFGTDNAIYPLRTPHTYDIGRKGVARLRGQLSHLEVLLSGEQLERSKIHQ